MRRAFSFFGWLSIGGSVWAGCSGSTVVDDTGPSDDAAVLVDAVAVSLDGGASGEDAETRLDDASSRGDATTLERDAGSGGGLPFESWLTTTHQTLFVGNSYTFGNDLPLLYGAIVERAHLAPRSVMVAYGGYTLNDHARDMRADGTELARWLRTGSEADRDWDFVVLQEQSQIGGYPTDDPNRQASIAAARTLGAVSMDQGARVVLFLTWGRERGDDALPTLFPDFLTMQDRLDANYRETATSVERLGVEVRIAPIGTAFRIMHTRASAGGADPTVEGSSFDALYESDGSHPSLAGSYLAAWVIFGTISAIDPAAVPSAMLAEPPSGLDAATARTLREIASEAILTTGWTPSP